MLFLLLLQLFFSNKGCTARSYWSYTRHGEKYPKDSEYDPFTGALVDIQERIVQNHQDGLGKNPSTHCCFMTPLFIRLKHIGVLCDGDLQLIQNWTYDWTLDQASKLTPSGWVTQEQLGNRFRQRFPELLDQPYEEDIFRVISNAHL